MSTLEGFYCNPSFSYYTGSSLVPRLSAQLFFARSKISGAKKLGREPGNEATQEVEVVWLPQHSSSLKQHIKDLQRQSAIP